jgi:hypothetical protein
MILYHTSNPFYRNEISKEGLIPKQETWGKSFGSDMNVELGENKAIFLSKNTPYDNGYDDDIYKVEVKNLKNSFTQDKYFKNGVYTLEAIPVKNIKLIYKGSGKSKD